ncbi:hypothetical protein SISNIDRAFT_467563 [Sistotremastrum niveocremeum HHB9708]|uniref:Novel STAND NTPase 1 domain-containing protein n=1 Tax=Sistotremastrum niveocremeum HHB9708 TaxID=1314777 RepID=A0A164SMJ6_9AGAM|nr:hypothetical protein SISNIDRAFT_467563 [Sistotremastrum niveocremeum HHB9708]
MSQNPLTVLRYIANFSPLPYPQGLASLAVLIHEISTSANEGIQSLVDRVVEATWVITNAMQDAGDTMTEELVRHVGQFLRSSSDQATLRKLEADLERSIEFFSIGTKLANLRLSFSLAENAIQHEDELAVAVANAYEEQDRLMTEVRSEDSQLHPKILPPSPQSFFGRSDTLQLVVQQLCDTKSVQVAILGSGGIGKTSLALAALHHPDCVRVYGLHRHFICCETATSTETFISALATAFDIEAPENIGAITKKLSQLKCRVLVVLDNFETTWEPAASRSDVESILTSLASIPTVSILLTIRGAERPGGIAWCRPFIPPLSSLDDEAAKQTFLAISDISERDEDLARLLELLDNVPLAVVLMANLAQYHTCGELLRQWHAERTSMLTRGYDGRLSSIDVSLRVSLSSERLKRQPKAHAVLQLLSLLPDGVSPENLPLMMADSDTLAPAISALRQVALISTDSQSTRLRALSPVREYMLIRHPVRSENLEPIQRYHFDLAKESAADTFTDKDQIARVQSQVVNVVTVLLASLRAENPSAEAIEATLHLLSFNSFASKSATSRELLPLALSAARKMGSKKLEGDCIVASYKQDYEDLDANVERLTRAITLFQDLEPSREVDVSNAIACYYLADCSRRAYDIEKAIAMFGSCIEVFGKYSLFRRQADTMRMLARTYEDTERIDYATTTAKQALDVSESHRFTLTTAYCQDQLGRIYFKRGLFILALPLFKTTAELKLSILGESSPYVMILLHLGVTLHMLGRSQEAHEVLEKAYHVSCRLQIIGYVLDTSRVLGHVALDQGLVSEALTRLHVCFRRFHELNWVGGQADCLIPIGEADFRQGHYATALSHYHESRRLFRSIKRAGTSFEADVLLKLGEVEVKTLDLSMAIVHLVSAALIYRQESMRLCIGECIKGVGDVFLERGELKDARSCYAASLGMVKYAGVRRQIADCLLKLGDLAIAESDVQTARSHYESSLEWYKKARHYWGERDCEERLGKVNEEGGQFKRSESGF